MITHLLDTNIVSYALKKQYPVVAQRVRSALVTRTAGISSITRAELQSGIARMDASDVWRLKIDKLLDATPCLDWGVPAADACGLIAQQLRAVGQPIGVMDTQIAAHALSANLVLVTHNTKHFERVAGLRMEDWV